MSDYLASKEIPCTSWEAKKYLTLTTYSSTLATKRRRILHVVADSWEDGGGHFERRISFGYDADLMHVRAEFDGELLRVIIPRRLPGGMSGAGASAMGRT